MRFQSKFAADWMRSMVNNPVSGSSTIGTELAQDFTVNFGGGLPFDFGAAVPFTGDCYRAGPAGPRPNNLYEGFAQLQLEFQPIPRERLATIRWRSAERRFPPRRSWESRLPLARALTGVIALALDSPSASRSIHSLLQRISRTPHSDFTELE
jgi:hypothetical protein